MELEMIRDGQGCADEVDKAYHDTMDLDHTHPVKRDPHHGLCFNCGKPGHIMKVCQGPHAQNIWNIDATTILRLTPKDLQFLVESLRATVTSSVPTMPPPELEGEKTPGDEGF